VVRYRDEEHVGKIAVSQTIISHVIARNEGVLSSNAMADVRFAKGKSVHNLLIRSAICVPIKGRERLLGVIHVDSSVANYTYTNEQLRLLTAIGLWWKIGEESRKWKVRYDTSVRALLEATKQNILKLVGKSDQAHIRTLDIRFEGGIYISLPVIIGVSYSPYPGLEMTGLRTNHDGTHYTLATQQPVTLVRHCHEEEEGVEVVSGTMTDLDSGRVYRRGETWQIDPNKNHRVYFESHGLFLCTIKPPLPLANDRPVNVDRLHELDELT
jgi:hypothetical protein